MPTERISPSLRGHFNNTLFFVPAVTESGEPSFAGMKKKKKKPVRLYFCLYFSIWFDQQLFSVCST
jgi:hypothetical protein